MNALLVSGDRAEAEKSVSRSRLRKGSQTPTLVDVLAGPISMLPQARWRASGRWPDDDAAAQSIVMLAAAVAGMGALILPRAQDPQLQYLFVRGQPPCQWTSPSRDRGRAADYAASRPRTSRCWTTA